MLGVCSLHAATGLIGSAGDGCVSYREAKVEVSDEIDTSKRFSGGVDAEGIFRFPDLPAGQYSVKVNGRDFKRHALRVVPGALTDVGAVTECIRINDHELLTTDSFRSWNIVCGVPGIYEPRPWCIWDDGRGFDDHRRDFWFRTAADGVYMIPFEGVSFSLNPSTVTYKRGCPNAAYLQGRIRIDSLPRGSRVCVRTGAGDYGELRITEEIVPNQQEVAMEYSDLGH